MKWLAAADEVSKIDKSVERHRIHIKFKKYDIYLYLRNVIVYAKANSETNSSHESNDPSVFYYPESKVIKNLSVKSIDEFATQILPSNFDAIYVDTQAKDDQFNRSRVGIFIERNCFISKINHSELNKVSRKVLFIKFLTILFYLVPNIIPLFKLARIAKVNFLLLLKSFIAYIVLYYQSVEYLSEKKNKDIVLFVAHYGWEFLIHAAQTLNRNVWEYQHGVLYEKHFGYQYETKDSGRLKLPVPDYFLFYDEYTSSKLKQSGRFKFMSTMIIGNTNLANRSHKLKSYNLEQVFFSQPRFFDKDDNASSNKIFHILGLYGYEKKFQIFKHPREAHLSTLNYVDNELNYTTVLSNAKLVVTCSPSVFYERQRIGLSCIYFDHELNIKELNLPILTS